MRDHYHFVSRWRIKAPLEKVWEKIYLSEEWPLWWKEVKSVIETEKGDERGIGSIRTYTLKSRMLYSLKFQLILTDRVENRLLRGTASGDLKGIGAWHFDHINGMTLVECHWVVTTNIWWMNWLSFLLRPVFKYNHEWVMKRGEEALIKELASIPAFLRGRKEV